MLQFIIGTRGLSGRPSGRGSLVVFKIPTRIRAIETLLLLGALALFGCTGKQRNDHRGNRLASEAPHAWVIESWENGVFTFRHGDYDYKATCDEMLTTTNGRTEIVTADGRRFAPGEPDYRGRPPRCEGAIGLVGSVVIEQDAGIRDVQKGSGGWATTIMHALDSLDLRQEHDKENYSDEMFRIVSVSKATDGRQ